MTSRNTSNVARILYLRTFKDATFDHMLIASLAMIVADPGRLVVLGSRNDEVALRAQWHKRYGENPAFSNHVEYKQSSDSEWRRIVHQEISKADIILLFIEAKDRRFPRFRRQKGSMFRDYFTEPFMKQATGSGLSYEVAYLERLGKIGRTIVLCRAKDAAHFSALIHQAYLSSAGSGILLKTTDYRRGVAKNLLPHFSALDAGLGVLYNKVKIVTFKDNELSNSRSNFSETLRSIMNDMYSRPRTGRGIGLNASARLLGRSDKPRRLPPDGEKKIIQFTNVEDLLRIPRYELTEVSSDDVSELLNSEGRSRGCPYCKQSLAIIFFYVRGLHQAPGDKGDDIKGRCQYCYGYIGICDGTLIPI